MTIIQGTMCLASVWVLTYGYNIDLVHPLIFSDPNNSPSLFGFKVQYLVTQDQFSQPPVTSILVGAPRANATKPADIQKNANEPGRIYQCAVDIQKGKCEEVVVDGNFGCCNKKQGDYPYGAKDNKNSSWLGGTLAVQSPTQGRVVVCGHRLKNNIYQNLKSQTVTGSCHFSNHTVNTTKNFVKILPLVNRLRNTDSINNNSLYYYQYGMAGFDAHFSTHPSKGPQELIMGAPGVYQWTGTIIRLQDSSTAKVHPNRARIHANYDDGHDFSDYLVPDPRKTSTLKADNYFGYTVSSGRFMTNTTSYAASAPRGSETKGRVLIFKFGKDENTSLEIEANLEGSQLGEYFGASLLALDLNNDGFDDLLVGAPLHTYSESKFFDDGRVYLFIGKLGRMQKSELEISGSRAPGGRFGSAIISAGDLNQDGHSDILIGAPYEGENKGAIYLYHGSSDGINQNYAQRIAAEQFEPGLSFRGFGIHMTSFDIDGNMYPDVLVGSYLSGHAVVLRSYPVVEFQLNLTAIPNQVVQMSEPVKLMACVAYHARKLIPAKLCASFTVLLDVGYNFGSRLKFTNRTAIADNKFTFTETLEANQTNCMTLNAIFTQSKVDNSRPISVQLTAELLNNTKQGPGKTPLCTKLFPELPGSQKITIGTRPLGTDNFCSSCPVVDKSYQSTTQIPFADACGNRPCVADLEVKGRFVGIPNGTDFVLGSQKRISIETSVHNHGEPASAATLVFHLPPNVTLARIPAKCHESPDKAKVDCNLGSGTLRNKDTDQILFSVDLSRVSLDTEFLTFYSEVTTKSDQKPSNFARNATLTINTHVVADIIVSGHVVRDQLTYDRPNDSFSGSLVPFNHQYEISKHQASPLDLIHFEFDVPLNLIVGKKNITIVEIYEAWATQDKNPLSCKGPFTYQHTEVDTGTFDRVEETEEISSRRRREVTFHDTHYKPRVKRGHDYPEVLAWAAQQNLTSDNQTSHAPMNRTSFFNCSMPNVHCGLVTCDAGSIENGTQISVLLKAAVKIEALWPYLDKREVIMISSGARVRILKPEKARQPAEHKPDTAIASTWFFPIQAQTEDNDPLWILIASGIGGLLILLLIGIILAQCGFFKRKKFDRLQQENQGPKEEQQETQPPHEENASKEFEFEEYYHQ